MLEQADGLEGVVAAVSRWGSEVIGSDDRFAGWHYRSAFKASLAGQLMVRSVELAEEADDGEPGTTTLDRAWTRNDPRVSFLGLPFDEAVAFFRDKEVLSPEEFDALQDRFRRGGFTARDLMSRALVERAQRTITKWLEQDFSIREIVQALRSDAIELGITPANNAALETIARNAVATSYGHGRWQAMNDPQVRRLRPYMLYVTAEDSRVRETHQRLNGLVFELGSELAALYAPPLGHRCRCSAVTLSERQLQRRGLRVTTTRVDNAGPDQGWEAPPAPLAA